MSTDNSGFHKQIKALSSNPAVAGQHRSLLVLQFNKLMGKIHELWASN